MKSKSTFLAAALLGLTALAVPAMGGSAQAAGIADSAAIAAHSDMLAASAFGVSVGTGRGVRVGVVIGTPKVVSKRKVLVRRIR